MAASPHIIYGGTFDPVHEGHLAVARAVRDRFGATVHFMPAADPPHRAGARADALHRLAMLQLAIGRERGLAVDTRELSRDGPSWTIDTVTDLRAELPAGTPLLLVIGMDSLRQFTTWKRWKDILAQAHLVACTRPGQGMPTARELGELTPYLATDMRELLDSPGGRVLIEASTAVNMAATTLRTMLAGNGSARPAGLAPQVLDYIHHHRLYADPAGATESE